MNIYRLFTLFNDAKAIANGSVGKRIVRRTVWSYGTGIIKKIVAGLGATR